MFLGIPILIGIILFLCNLCLHNKQEKHCNAHRTHIDMEGRKYSPQLKEYRAEGNRDRYAEFFINTASGGKSKPKLLKGRVSLMLLLQDESQFLRQLAIFGHWSARERSILKQWRQ